MSKIQHLNEIAPLRFVGAVITGPGALVLRLASEAEKYEIEVSGVRESSISSTGEELVTAIEVHREHPFLWNYGPWSTIFGNAPLPDAPKFLYDFQELVLDKLKVERDPLDYLFFSERIAQWREFVYSRAYTLLNAPRPIAEAVVPILERQAAEFALLDDPDRSGEETELYLIDLVGAARLVCEKAKVSSVVGD